MLIYEVDIFFDLVDNVRTELFYIDNSCNIAVINLQNTSEFNWVNSAQFILFFANWLISIHLYFFKRQN